MPGCAHLQDENKDGLFTVDEFRKWIETNKLLQLVKDGQDGDLDRILEQVESHSKDGNQDAKVPPSS